MAPLVLGGSAVHARRKSRRPGGDRLKSGPCGVAVKQLGRGHSGRASTLFLSAVIVHGPSFGNARPWSRRSDSESGRSPLQRLRASCGGDKLLGRIWRCSGPHHRSKRIPFRLWKPGWNGKASAPSPCGSLARSPQAAGLAQDASRRHDRPGDSIRARCLSSEGRTLVKTVEGTARRRHCERGAVRLSTLGLAH